MAYEYDNIRLINRDQFEEIVNYLNGCNSVARKNGSRALVRYEGNGEGVQAIRSGHILFNVALPLIALSRDLQMHPTLEKELNGVIARV